MQIYVHHNNQQLGPFTEAEVKARLASGTLSPQDHVWWQGQATWIPLSQSPLATNTLPVIPSIPAPLPGPHLSHEKTSNLALGSLICGITSFFCGITFIPAIILGHLGLAEIHRNPAIKGRGMAWAGLIMGYVIFALYIILAISCSIFIALGGQLKDTLKSEMKSFQISTSDDDSDSSQSTNSPDQSTTNAPSADSSDTSTNSAPTVTP